MRIIKPSKRPRSGRLNRQAHLSAHKEGESHSRRDHDHDNVNREDTSQVEIGGQGHYLDNQLSSIQASDIFRSDDESVTEADDCTQVRKKHYSLLMAKAVRLLAMREHSVQELHSKLSARADGFVDLVDTVVEAMLKEGYLSNERYAESYTRSRLTKGFGPVRIKLELQNKGIEPSLIEEHVDARSAHWLDVAGKQYLKKYGDKPISDYNAWSKRARFLQGRGFTMEHIHSVVPSVVDD